MKTPLVAVIACVAALLMGAAALRAQHMAVLPGHEIVIAGPEVGFRIDHYNGTTPIGELVVKRDGVWVAVEFGAKIRPMK